MAKGTNFVDNFAKKNPLILQTPASLGNEGEDLEIILVIVIILL